MKLLKDDFIPVSKPYLDSDDKISILNTVKSSWISSNGKNILAFEKKFNQFLKSRYALTVSNGTVALELALKSIGEDKRNEVIVPNITFAASINAVINSGLKPVLVDVNSDGIGFDINSLNKSISNKTLAVMFVHIYGIPLDVKYYSKLLSLKNRNIYVIEDCAESLGSKINNNHTGTLGDFGTFSFFSNKMITTGEGGMVIFKNKKNFDLAKKIRNQGRSQNKFFWHDVQGSNYRMTNIQASLGITQLKKFNFFYSERQRIFSLYDNYFKKNEMIKPFHLFFESPKIKFSFWYYTIAINKFNETSRDKLILKLKNNNIETRPFFYPLNTMDIFKKYSNGRYNNSKNISYVSLSLPTFIGLKKKEIIRIASTINSLI